MSENKMTTVYDWPTRIFHWLLAALFLVAYLIANITDDENSLFSLHMMAGLTIGFLLILRILWGLAGTTYARFSSFKLNPAELWQYFKDALVSKTKRYLGHNPASSYAAVIMFFCAAGLVTTGILMTGVSENEFYEEIHELLANIFLITVIVHVMGIIFHHVKHRDALWSSMFDGKKWELPGKTGITSSKRLIGILFFILTFIWTGYLYSNYNWSTHTLNVLGQELVLGEADNETEYDNKTEADEAEDADNEYDDD